MELAIIAGLSALGWRLAAKGADSRDLQETPQLLPQDNEYPFETQVESRVLLNDDIRRAREHVARVDAQLRPFLTSDKASYVKTQRRMELFTGAEDTWRHKAETPEIFRPAEKRVAVSSGGLARSADPLYDSEELVDRNVFGSRLNNVLPFEQKRIGPGLGVAADVPSADGLHSQFRVLPTEALNAHRINQLPGRAASGASQIASGGRRYDTFKQNKPSLVDIAPQLGAGKSTNYTAPAALPMPDHKPTRAQGTSQELRGPVYVASRGAVVVPEEGHVQRRALPTPAVIRSRAPQLAPTEYATQYVATERGTQRLQDGSAGLTGTSGTRFQQYTRDGLTLKARKDPLAYGGEQTMAGGASAIARGSALDGSWVVKHTARDVEGPGAVPGAAVVGAGSVRVCEPGVSGLREAEADNTGGYSWLHKPQVGAGVALGCGRETQGRTEIGGLLGGLTTDLQHAGRIRGKQATQNQNAYGKPLAGAAKYALQRAAPGRSKVDQKVVSENPRGTADSLGLGLFCGGQQTQT